MTQYDAKLDVPVAFPPQSLAMILGEVLSQARADAAAHRRDREVRARHLLLQRRREEAFPAKSGGSIPSNRDVATYDLEPEMSAAAVADSVVRRSSPAVRLHPGELREPRHGRSHRHAPAAITAVETIDAASGASSTPRRARRGRAHHRRSRQLRADDRPRPASRTRRTRPTRCRSSSIATRLIGRKLRAGGRLCDVAPTVLELMKIAQPSEMDGRSCSSEHRQASHRFRARRAELAARARRARGETKTNVRMGAETHWDGGDPSKLSDRELAAEIERRRAARQEVEDAVHGRRSAAAAANGTAAIVRAAAAPNRGRGRSDSQGLRRAGGPRGL